MIEMLIYVGGFLLLMLVIAILVASGTEVARPPKYPKMTAADLGAPPPWAEARFRCPNCECKWCRFGAN